MVLQLSIRSISCPGVQNSFFVMLNKEYQNITYFDIKIAIFNKFEFPINHQRLVLCGEEKEDNRLVIEDEIIKKACLHLVGVNIEKN